MGYLGNFRAKPSSIVTADIAAGQITTALIADDGITAAKIADDAVVAAAIADNAVVTAAINADAVTGAKIADNAVVGSHAGEAFGHRNILINGSGKINQRHDTATNTTINTYAMDRWRTHGGPNTFTCLLYTSPSPRDGLLSRMPSSA